MQGGTGCMREKHKEKDPPPDQITLRQIFSVSLVYSASIRSVVPKELPAL